MMKCKVIEDLLPLYLDKACSRESRELVEEHLKDCPACCERLKKMQKNLEPGAEEIEANMLDEKLLEEGKNMIKKHAENKVKKDYLEKAVIVDFLLNLAITAGAIYLIAGRNYEEMARYDLEFMIPVAVLAAIAVPVMFIVWEIVFFVGEHKGKYTATSQMVAMASVLIKIFMLIIAAIFGIAFIVKAFFVM